MNKLFYLTISYIIFPIATLAQAFTPVPIEVSLDLYVGTWKYENLETNEVFTIKLKKFDNYCTFYSNHGTIIIGEYSYTKNSITIHNSLTNLESIVTNDDALNASINGFGNHKNKDYTKLHIWVSDRTHEKLISGTIKFALSRTSQTLIWKIAEDEEGDIDIGPDYIEGISIPSNIVLTKISD